MELLCATEILNGRLTRTRVVAAATTNATVLKAAPGNVYGWYFENNAAYDVFVKFYDKATAPTVGTDAPAWTVKVPTGVTPAIGYFNIGIPFTVGISFAITKLSTDADTTVVVLNDCQGLFLTK